MARSINIKRLLNNTRGGIGTTLNKTYRNFFSKSAEDLFHASNLDKKMGYPSGKTTALKPILPGNSGQLKTVGKTFGDYTKQTNLSYSSYEAIYVECKEGSTRNGLSSHLKALEGLIDKNLWLFVQAMGSHQKRMFQDSFSRHKFSRDESTGSWRSLKNKTLKRRRRLGLWPGRSGILGATGRLQDSLTLTPSANMARPLVIVSTDPNKFKGAYPEWVGAEKPRKNRGQGKSDTGKVSGMQVDGRPVYGRKDRVYAAIHNEKFIKGAPQRRFMGILEQLTPAENQLIDDYLFYSVFSTALGFKTAGEERHATHQFKRNQSDYINAIDSRKKWERGELGMPTYIPTDEE